MTDQKPIGYISTQGIDRLKSGHHEVILDEVRRDYTQPVYLHEQSVPSQVNKDLIDVLEDALWFIRVDIEHEQSLPLCSPEDIKPMEEKYKRYEALLNMYKEKHRDNT